MHKIKDKQELIILCNSLNRLLDKSRRALHHYNQLVHCYHNGFKPELKMSHGYWDSVASAFLDSCASSLCLFYDKQVTGTKGDQINATMDLLFCQLKTNRLLHSWIPSYNQKVLGDLKDDYKQFVSDADREILNNLRSKVISHRDFKQMMEQDKPIAMEIEKFGSLRAEGGRLLKKYGSIFEYEINSKIYMTNMIEDQMFEELVPGVRPILIGLRKTQ